MMKWHRITVTKSSKTKDVLIQDIAKGLELEKSFFIHQIVHSIFPFFNRQNKFEGVIKNNQFSIFGRRMFWGAFVPFVINIKGHIQSKESGSEVELSGSYTFLGKYYVTINILAATVCGLYMIIQNQINDLWVPFLINAVGCYFLIPIFAQWNFQSVTNAIQEIINEHNIKCQS